MIREAKEEFGIIPLNYSLRGILDYNELYKGKRIIVRTHIYTANKYIGTPIKTNEMTPIWIDTNNIPYNKMFNDDILWYQQLLNGYNFKGEIIFDDNFNISSHNINFFKEDIIVNY